VATGRLWRWGARGDVEERRFSAASARRENRALAPVASAANIFREFRKARVTQILIRVLKTDAEGAPLAILYVSPKNNELNSIPLSIPPHPVRRISRETVR
jgi:hypothetical protein